MKMLKMKMKMKMLKLQHTHTMSTDKGENERERGGGEYGRGMMERERPLRKFLPGRNKHKKKIWRKDIVYKAVRPLYAFIS